MAKNKYNPIEEKHVTRKDFSYSKNDVSLAFKVRIDIRTEAEIFKELMLKAIEDLDKELEAIK